MASTPRLAPGTSFAGDFRVLAPLAEGGMGSVYRAEQLSTHKLRALKIVHGRLLEDERSRARFLREATIGASIASEHVVEVISAGIDAATELPYLVMELLEGADLGTVVRNHGRLSVGELAAAMRQLCHGMGAAHQVKVVHRDLKPENIYVAYPRHAGAKFTVKILDFGIARIAQESTTAATLTGSVGSPLWMAPEQINSEAIVPATDVWALGLLAFWALVGQPYWRTARSERLTVQALFVEQLFREIEPASARADEIGMAQAIPPGFDDWFRHCVARPPGERFADANAAWSAFAQAVDPGLDPLVSLLPPPDKPWPSSGSARLAIVEATAPDSAVGERGSDERGALPTSGIDLFSPTVAGTTMVEPLAPDAAPVAHEPGAAAKAMPWWALALVPAIALPIAAGIWWIAQRDDPPTSAAVEPTPPLPEPVSPPPIEDPPKSSDDGANAHDDGHHVHDPVLHDPIASVRPMATQPSYSSAALAVLGWTPDGARFVLDATYPDRDGMDGAVTKLRLVEVHDSLTGAMIASYLAENEHAADAPSHDRLVRAALEAEPLSEWDFARAQLELVAAAPSRESTIGEGTIEAAIESVPDGTTVAVEQTATGIHWRWSLGPLPLPEPEPITPRIRLRWIGGGARWDLLDVPIAIRTSELVLAAVPGEESPVLEGDVALHFSPEGHRVLVVITGRASHVLDPGRMFDVRWFLRANGPQIRLVDAGLGERRLRALAHRLGDAGLPIAAAELDSEAIGTTRIYVRARDPAAADLATRLNAALGTDYPSALLERAGWTQVVMVLGSDAP
ncbi:MAG TPA: serine/threonine-protein kinase [Nannocystaceae bacterium]|nr:serine/threonine-protein kinase [Nannocystaceae bacterium]